MNNLGIQLQVMMGTAVPLPVPPKVARALQRVEVTHSDEGPSGFQMTFNVEQNGPSSSAASAMLKNPLFKVFNRMIVTTIFKGKPQVLIDGIITNQEHQPVMGQGTSLLTLTGEDVSVMMDLEEKSVEHPAQDDNVIAMKIIASYAKYGLIPLVKLPLLINPPLPSERTPVQQGTDMAYLKQLAQRHAYVFYVTPGPAPLTNTAYWGPPIRIGNPQKALSVNMGPHSNVESISFRHNSLAPVRISGKIQDRTTNQVKSVQTFDYVRPPLASQPNWQVYRQHLRTKQFRESGLTDVQANARAQAMMEQSMEEVVTAIGEVNNTRYGTLLEPRKLVGLRGAGASYDGFYYVKRVSHIITRGEYKQSFTLSREGLGTTTPVVRP